jgi:signal transduction histidine kinase
MRERLEMVGGHFEIESAPGKGTTIMAQIPPGNGSKKTEKGKSLITSNKTRLENT